MTISCWILLRMRNVSNKSCREHKSTHFMFNNFFSEIYAIYEIVSKNVLEPERPQMSVWWRSMCAHTHTHTCTPTCVCAPACTHARACKREKYVTFIAFPCHNGFANMLQCYVPVFSLWQLHSYRASYQHSEYVLVCNMSEFYSIRTVRL